MAGLGERLMVISLAAILSASCATAPPPVRAIPPETLERAKETARLQNERWVAEELSRELPQLLASIDARLSEALRADLLAALSDLQRALDRNDTDAIRTIYESLGKEASLVSGHAHYAAEVQRLRTVVGSEPISPVNADIDATLADAKRALSGRSWEDVEATLDALIDLDEQKLHTADYYKQLLGELDNLGEINPELTRQITASLEPLHRVLQRGSWDEMRSFDSSQLPEQIHYPRRINEKLAWGQDKLRYLGPHENQDLSAALAAARAALMSTSWAQAMTRADQIPKTVEQFEFADGSITPAPCIRILSIDGGGIRGIIPAAMLAALEARTGKSIFALFDVIAGTSTGGILALGLTVPDSSEPWHARYSAADLVKMYKDEGATIFPSTPLKSLRGMVAPKYHADALENLLKSYFGDALLREALTDVLIPTYSLDGAGHIFLDNYRDAAFYVYMWEAARATSAAPTYFPPFRIPLLAEEAASSGLQGASFIDGGVFANNPAPFAISMAKNRELSGKKRPYDPAHPLLLLSLGTGRVPAPPDPDAAWSRGTFGWIRPLIDILLSDPGIEQEVRQLVGGLDYYYRFQPQSLSDSTGRLDNVTPENIRELERIAHDYLESPEGKAQFDSLALLLGRERAPECSRLRD